MLGRAVFVRALLRAELAAGALGLSSGLEYEPGIYSTPAEVLLLAQESARAGGRYISHLRSEDRWFEDAVEEIIRIGRVTGMPVKISHIKLAMTRLWDTAPALIAQLDAARADRRHVQPVVLGRRLPALRSLVVGCFGVYGRVTYAGTVSLS